MRQRYFRTVVVGMLAAFIGLGALQAAERNVSNAEELDAAIAAAEPGDHIVMQDGTWTDVVITFETDGTPDAPVTLRAQTPGQVTITGASCAAVRGENLIVSGLVFRDGSPPVSRETGSLLRHRSILSIGGADNRVTDCAFIDYNSNEEDRVYHWVAIGGRDNRVDHCYFRGQTDVGNTLMADVRAGRAPAAQVDHNHFAGRPPLGRNGGETIRIGLSSTSVYNGHCIVEENLFEDCDGEGEIISNKSCENTYRHNTFRHCDGHLTLRHGERCVVEGNFIFGDGKDGANGIRVINRDQRVFNNYIADTDQFGILMQAGWPEAALNEYTQVQGAVIAFNTIVNSGGPCLNVGGFFWDPEDYEAVMPTDSMIANNVLFTPDGEAIHIEEECENLTWAGNIAWGTETDTEIEGVRRVDPMLQKDEAGIWRPFAESPAINAAAGEVDYENPTPLMWQLANILHDMDGQRRDENRDIGCDEVSDTNVHYRPLTAADVGPSWMQE